MTKTIKLGAAAALLLLASASLVHAQPVRADSVHASSAILLIPVAANLPGAQDTFFRTDLHIVNQRDVPEEVRIELYLAGEFHYGPAWERDITLKGRSVTTLEDVIRSFVTYGAMGSIVIRSRARFPSDLDAKLDANYRIWTPQPGGRGGTMSQSSSAIDIRTLPKGRATRSIIGVRLDSDFRCNVGIYTDSYYDRSFRITATSPSGSVTKEVTVVGLSMAQVALPFAELGYVTVTVEPLNSNDEDKWTAYASSVDNLTGDSWLQNATAEQ